MTSSCRTGTGIDWREEEALGERGERLLEEVAERYEPTQYHDRGKYSFPKAIARMERHGPEDPQAERYLEEYAAGRYDFFHFPFIGLARIFGLYPEASVVVRNREAFLRRILYHDPVYHYNALTGEGTENHVAMSRTSGYLFAQEGLRYGELAERAREWQARLKPWLLQWAGRAYEHGTGEWDSNPYTAYNLIGWLNLYDFAEDAEIRSAARAVLDYYAANIALKYTQGIYGGPESRGDTRYGPLPRSSTEYIAWFWFGLDGWESEKDFFNPSEYIQVVHAATSSYRPPAALYPLARKEIPTPSAYRLSKPDYLMTRSGLSGETFLIEKSFTAGTVQTPYGGWTNASYGIVNWKVVIKNGEGHPAILWGNGGMKSTSHARGRNPFDQFLQAGRVIVQMTRVPSDAEEIRDEVAGIAEEWRKEQARDFQARWGKPHREHPGPISDNIRADLGEACKSLLYLPAGARVESSRDVVFLSHAGTCLAVYSLGGQPIQRGEGVLFVEMERDELGGLLVELANLGDHGTLETFMEACLSRERLRPEPEDEMKFHYLDLDGNVVTFRYAEEGGWREMQFDWGYGILDRQVGFNSEAWHQPDWPEGDGQGRIPLVEVNGEPVPPLPSATIIEGPRLVLENRVMRVFGKGKERYRVDYRGPEPVFSGGRPE
ncbi:MAG: hypothetical protein ACP5I4_06985 [Oceanipulchritudo sp.]